LPKSNTFNGPPFSNPSRRHHHNGKTVWRFEVKVIVMVKIFIVRIYYLKMQFVKGFDRILRVLFCDAVAQSNRQFMSDLSIDMKEKVKTRRRQGGWRLGKTETFHVFRCRP
jgi:hypothetical protein